MTDRICTADGCSNKFLANGWCSPHYQRVMRYGEPQLHKPLLVRAARGTKAPECIVPGCDRPERTRGWCMSHYTRWTRHGDPLAGRTMPGEARAYFLANLPIVQPECKVWPYSKTKYGYGHFTFEGTKYLVHVLACEAANGPKQMATLQAAHGPCHLPACWNGAHLSWKTPAENTADMVRDGTRLQGELIAQAKLTEADIREIRRRRAAGESRISLGAEFGVHPEHVGMIVSRRSWAHVE